MCCLGAEIVCTTMIGFRKFPQGKRINDTNINIRLLLILKKFKSTPSVLQYYSTRLIAVHSVSTMSHRREGDATRTHLEPLAGC